MTDTYSVSYVTTYLRDLLESDPFLSQLSVRGEVSNWTQARSGHCYFTLKDDQAELRCVMWRTIAQQLSILPQNGDEVIAEGRISIYPQRGAYQFYVNMMQPIGLGVLYKRFEALKKKLAMEGLFDEWHKKPLPSFPRRIGIVTSPTAAALQDILKILKRRQPLAEVILSPTLVQGSRAPAQIVKALKRFDAQESAVDVILLARGGGSIEDLWAFNDEVVARAIYDSQIPIISGIGHEVDFTIADFVADKRAPTPSTAAELAVPDIQQLRERLQIRSTILDEIMQSELHERRAALEQEKRALERLAPQNRLQEQRQTIDLLNDRLERALVAHLELKRSKLTGLEGRLSSLNPRATIARGYAIVTDERRGTLIRSVRQTIPGQTIRITLEKGEFKAIVKGAKGTEWVRG